MAGVEKPFIGVDLDGVFYDWDLAARTALHEHRGVDIGRQPSSYWSEIKDLISKDDWDWIWDMSNDAIYSYDLHHSGSMHALKQLTRSHEVIIITARPYQYAAATAAWLVRNKIQPYGVFHTPHKHLVPIRCEAYIEDRAENVDALAEAHPHAQIFMPRRNWNADAEAALTSTYENVKPFDDWKDVFNWLD